MQQLDDEGHPMQALPFFFDLIMYVKANANTIAIIIPIIILLIIFSFYYFKAYSFFTFLFALIQRYVMNRTIAITAIKPPINPAPNEPVVNNVPN